MFSVEDQLRKEEEEFERRRAQLMQRKYELERVKAEAARKAKEDLERAAQEAIEKAKQEALLKQQEEAR